MHKFLLIHNNKTKIDEQYINDMYTLNLDKSENAENVVNSNIDQYISEEVICEISKKEFDILFIKDNLSNNYLDFYGLILAHHIRLSEELGNKRFVPIVILSDINSLIINKLTHYGRILFTKDVYLGKNNQSTIENYISTLTRNKLNTQNFKTDFLNLIEIEKPIDYLSNHTISNEWSMYRWAKYLEISAESIKKVTNNVSFMLYFKYLKNLYPIEKLQNFKIANTIKGNCKILYIDDEWDKGWNDILKKLFMKSENDIEYSCIEEKFKDKDVETILNISENKINHFNPDVIILDMRLHDTDFKDSVEELSGIKLLKKIKMINKGIHVIAFTASQDSLILENLFNEGIIGYIKKEHPENHLISTTDNIKKLLKLIQKALNKKELKDIYLIKNKINNTCEKDLNLYINSIFDILESNIPNNTIYAMFAIFKCLEILKNKYIKNKTTFVSNNQQIKYLKANNQNVYIPVQIFDRNDYFYKSTCNQLMNTAYYSLNIKDKEVLNAIAEISYCRNYYVHGKKDNNYSCDLIEDPTLENLLSWMMMLEKIVIKHSDLKNKLH